MGVPKHKPVKLRTRMRRSNGYYNKKAPGLSVCPNCGEKKEPHRVCPYCGFYKGKQIVSKVVKDKSKKE